MISLNAFLPALSELVGVSPGVLYERQRSLVKHGLIKSRPGRGPGSGVPLTYANVAMLLIAYMAADALADVPMRVERAANGKARAEHNENLLAAQGRPTKANFQETIEGILADPEMAASVESIEIDLAGSDALVSWLWLTGKQEYTRFSFTDQREFTAARRRELHGIAKKAFVTRTFLIDLSTKLKSLVEDGAISPRSVDRKRSRPSRSSKDQKA
ncbi:hypothetical protein AS156_00930 [Bradyrhizobium macuxiense]|uniref:Uncharacterized protein n=1 Tax=Bradyrhizobium macuxiense TaxID=1755647 RepID=A0A109JSH9_9BRAD|nr:hypothetical protein [Bradyrhizobium macuxiense]KWV54323.1 hypothetical protein AS156_00930 [Bradyrhizobium macuxiense]